jgi:hypothetical protein
MHMTYYQISSTTVHNIIDYIVTLEMHHPKIMKLQLARFNMWLEYFPCFRPIRQVI